MWFMDAQPPSDYAFQYVTSYDLFVEQVACFLQYLSHLTQQHWLQFQLI
jgi:hypothetical protein